MPIGQVMPGSSTGGQCGNTLKSPVAAIPAMLSGPSPRLVSVTVCCADEAPTFWLKLSRLGPRRASAMVDIPMTGIRWGLSIESSATRT